jgi:hypothetical protein
MPHTFDFGLASNSLTTPEDVNAVIATPYSLFVPGSLTGTPKQRETQSRGHV